MQVEPKIPRNIYRYVTRENDKCPVCLVKVDRLVLVAGQGLLPNSDYKYCHPLKRVMVSGMLWWSKACPVNGCHFHMNCGKCDVQWLFLVEGDNNFNVEETAYGK